MVIPGYDPDDLDDALETMLEREDPSDYLDESQMERWQSGESLLDVLDDEAIKRLIEKAPEDVKPN